MDYNIIIANKKVWLKDISQLSKKELERIIKKIRELKSNPWPEGLLVKKLKGYVLADFRLRVGNYRILFDRDLLKKEVVLFRVLHRSKLY